MGFGVTQLHYILYINLCNTDKIYRVRVRVRVRVVDSGVEPKAPLSSWDFSVPQRYEQWDSYKVRSLEPETS